MAQKAQFSANEFLVKLAEASNSLFMVLNENRQIVFANQKLIELLQKDLDMIAGMRTGEMLYCKNARESENGCGTHENCKGMRSCKFDIECIEW
ncbi:MAG: hypothetical protein U5Q03_01330 [Bacteroidota bacterium]|nr:hypothetical protein [Bacteroidota bacterium]